MLHKVGSCYHCDQMILIFKFAGNVKINELTGNLLMDTADILAGSRNQCRGIRKQDILRGHISMHQRKGRQSFQAFT